MRRVGDDERRLRHIQVVVDHRWAGHGVAFCQTLQEILDFGESTLAELAVRLLESLAILADLLEQTLRSQFHLLVSLPFLLLCLTLVAVEAEALLEVVPIQIASDG